MPTTSAILFTSLFVIAMAASGRAAALAPDFEAALRSQNDIYIATKRASGSRSKAVPVWFWWDADNHVLYTSTSPTAHKAKRIRKGSPVYIAVQGTDGPFLEGTPEIVTDPKLIERIGDGYSNKYWVAWLGFFRPRVSRVESGKTVVIKVVFKPQ